MPPRTVPATSLCFNPQGLYLCDGALSNALVLWVGSAAPPTAVQELCAAADAAGNMVYLEGGATGTPTAKHVAGLVEACRTRSRRRPPVAVVVQGTPQEASVMKGFWVEDRLLSEGVGQNAPPGSGASIGLTYAEFLAQLYRQTMQRGASQGGAN